MYILKNMSSSTVAIMLTNAGFQTILKPNQSVPIQDSVRTEIQYDPGCLGLLEKGAIKVFESEAKMIPNRSVSEIIEEKRPEYEKIVLSKDETIQLLKTGDITAFTQVIMNASPVTLTNIVEAAVTLAITTPSYVSLIKKYTGIDVIDQLAKRQENS